MSNFRNDLISPHMEFNLHTFIHIKKQPRLFLLCDDNAMKNEADFKEQL